jgi:metal-responsive CopG/Arc/MetJ family transcriptional regulator
MKVDIRDELVQGIDAVAQRRGQSREALIDRILETFLIEDQRHEAADPDVWKDADAQDYVDRLRAEWDR